MQRKRTKGARLPPNTVCVDRSTRWGNPFPAGNEGVQIECLPLGLDGDDPRDRATAAVDLFRRWLTGGKVNELIALFLPNPGRKPPPIRIIQRELAGKNLACWCELDQPCHADVLLELANAEPAHER
ncbi:MAG: DUF4326 domain-containing protein [Deltaproteobacteria bacterium]|nr:DUF4326 domain-containing protein [Deltaproteobacteria bacterium]